MGTVGIVVQARESSTRLPGKVLKLIDQHTVLSHVLRRCKVVKGVDVVCCAVAEGSKHDRVADEALACGATVIRGSESDVLDRYRRAAEQLNLTEIIRVTSDCPLIDPGLCSQVLDALLSKRADYACNNMPPSFPHGLDCEAFTASALYQAAQNATLPDEREHVTPWLRTRTTIKRAFIVGPGGAIIKQRWTLDYEEDLQFMRRLFQILPKSLNVANYECVMQVIDQFPELQEINMRRRDSGRISGIEISK
ncbi:cytidylyltransferase domain-containing protein [Methylobacterium sp. PvR107]|uniref:cytidylyltransferase domain-containing protein n=1 Tax=Methylobacterium sp. PvR107 TaxID=2806597 RepID=UPI001AE7D085|nr:glycosyltransferase family protein [Methylobacterium sp. PvR107]MBP1178465.1 spore coat polysaccharide biosynthesis protein SpsF (cytidylyltransferase family) [Methylobacterium sp. PvR107]